MYLCIHLLIILVNITLVIAKAYEIKSDYSVSSINRAYLAGATILSTASVDAINRANF